MHEPPAALRRRFPGHEWIPVTSGHSGAGVWRLDGKHRYYAKIGDAEVWAEAERLGWLATVGIPAPAVVEAGTSGELAWLVSTAVPGRTAADQWHSGQRAAVIEAVAWITRALHDIPRSDCPFERGLRVTVPQARSAAEAGLVDLDDLDEERAGWTVAELLAELERTRPATEDLVVCHGDLCLPNLLIDPETLRVNGMIDVGRLGIADRYADLALMTRSITADSLNPQYGGRYAEQFLTSYGEFDVAEERLQFYRLLDEFY